MVPCKECLLIPLCKNKKYVALFLDCDLILEYIPKFNKVTERNGERIIELIDVLKPTNWKYGRILSKFHSDYHLVEQLDDRSDACNIVGINKKKGCDK